jgi:subtilisin family serine protease
LAHISTELGDDQNVLAIEVDQRVQATLTPNDTYWAQQWGPSKTRVSAAWDATTGRESIVIAVLDTGIDLDHSDLAGQVWMNPGEVPENGLDDDENGQVDDIYGWRFGQDQDDDIADDHGHGTHVSGIIAARGNNQTGIAGMAWGCRIMVVKVLDYKGDGYYSDVANGLVYATDNGARIANLSLGGDEPSQVIKDAVDYARAHGTLVVAAAGNTRSEVLYPAAYEGALAIAASDQNDRRAPYSNHGPEVDLAAPGSSIYSTCVGNSYCYKSGTSMAAPHVSGLAALIWSVYPDHTAAQVTERLQETAQDIESPGWDEYTGWGRIDAQNALVAMEAPWTFYLPIIACDSPLP